MALCAFCLEAVKRDELAIKAVPATHKTPALCLEAVRQNGRVLEFMPERHRTEKLCLATVPQNGAVLDLVPAKMRTTAVALPPSRRTGWPCVTCRRNACLRKSALRPSGSREDPLVRPPISLTPELCAEAVRQAPGDLDDVPKA